MPPAGMDVYAMPAALVSLGVLLAGLLLLMESGTRRMCAKSAPAPRNGKRESELTALLGVAHDATGLANALGLHKYRLENRTHVELRRLADFCVGEPIAMDSSAMDQRQTGGHRHRWSGSDRA